ncbi:unnamed protein product, partial [Prorocentrum cordatum]
MMVENLAQRGCPLLSIHEYPTLQAQRERYLQRGWERCSLADMKEVYYKHLDQADVDRINKLELLDEFEEFHLIQQHYFFLAATRAPGGAAPWVRGYAEGLGQPKVACRAQMVLGAGRRAGGPHGLRGGRGLRPACPRGPAAARGRPRRGAPVLVLRRAGPGAAGRPRPPAPGRVLRGPAAVAGRHGQAAGALPRLQVPRVRGGRRGRRAELCCRGLRARGHLLLQRPRQGRAGGPRRGAALRLLGGGDAGGRSVEGPAGQGGVGVPERLHRRQHSRAGAAAVAREEPPRPSREAWLEVAAPEPGRLAEQEEACRVAEHAARLRFERLAEEMRERSRAAQQDGPRRSPGGLLQPQWRGGSPRLHEAPVRSESEVLPPQPPPSPGCALAEATASVEPPPALRSPLEAASGEDVPLGALSQAAAAARDAPPPEGPPPEAPAAELPPQVSHTLATLHTDYGFLGKKTEVETLEKETIPFVVVKDGPPPMGARWLDSHAVQSKGTRREHSSKIVAQDIGSGHGKFVFKSDGEPALLALKKGAISEIRRTGAEVNVIPVESPVGDSQKNGYIERAIWEVQALTRALVHHAAERHKTKFESASPIVIWAIRYSRLLEFGELLMFLTVAGGKHRRKLDERFHAGMYVGLVDRTDEVIVLTREGYFKANTTRRLPEEQRSDKVFAGACKGLPWWGPKKTGDDAENVMPFLAEPAPMEAETQGAAAAAAASPMDVEGQRKRSASAAAPSTDAAGDTEMHSIVKEVNYDLAKIGGTRIEIGSFEAKVSEIFGRGKFLERSKEFGLVPGFAIDLSTGWDLNDPVQKEEARRLRGSQRPLLLIGSPRCTAWTASLSFGSVSEETMKQLMMEAIDHMDTCIEMYWGQIGDKHYFLHEAPNTARSWHTQGVLELLAADGVYCVRNDQCEAGQTVPVKDEHGTWTEKLVQACAAWMTNSRCIAEELAAFQRRNRRGWRQRSCADSFRKQLECDKLERGAGISLGSLDQGYTADTETREMVHLPEYGDIWVVTGAHLPPEKARVARAKEVKFLKDFPVYEKVGAREAEGGEVLDTRRVDVNKGDNVDAQVRSRICAKEFKWKNPWMEDVFAGTPPWEGIKMALSRAMARSKVGASGKFKVKKVLILDISRAHFHPQVERNIFIRPPAEDAEEGNLGKPLPMMHGMRDAANAWEEFYQDKLLEAKYAAGTSCPCAFNDGHDSSGVVHGDDFAFEGEEFQLDALEAELRKHMIVQRKALLGPDVTDDKYAVILNRLVSYVDAHGRDGARMEIEPGPRHAEFIIHQLGPRGKGSKAVTTPSEKGATYYDETPLQGEKECNMYRSLCMRLSFMAQDAPHLQYVANKCCKFMAVPSLGGLARLKRLARFLKGEPRCVQHLVEQYHDSNEIDTHCDSDWAGDLADRKSTSAVWVFYGKHLLRSSVSTQGTIALSSGEAEFTAGAKASAVSLGIKSLGADLGQELGVNVRADSTASKGVFRRRGVGRIRHLHAPLLWVQQKRAQKELNIRKVPGEENPADLGANELARPVMEKHLTACCFYFARGSHPRALSAQLDSRPGEVNGLSGDGGDQSLKAVNECERELFAVDPTLHYLNYSDCEWTMEADESARLAEGPDGDAGAQLDAEAEATPGLREVRHRAEQIRRRAVEELRMTAEVRTTKDPGRPQFRGASADAVPRAVSTCGSTATSRAYSRGAARRGRWGGRTLGPLHEHEQPCAPLVVRTAAAAAAEPTVQPPATTSPARRAAAPPARPVRSPCLPDRELPEAGPAAAWGCTRPPDRAAAAAEPAPAAPLPSAAAADAARLPPPPPVGTLPGRAQPGVAGEAAGSPRASPVRGSEGALARQAPARRAQSAEELVQVPAARCALQPTAAVQEAHVRMRTVPTPTRTGTGQLPVQRAARVVHVVRVQPQQQQQQGQQQGQQQQKQLPDRGSAEVPAGKPAQVRGPRPRIAFGLPSRARCSAGRSGRAPCRGRSRAWPRPRCLCQSQSARCAAPTARARARSAATTRAGRRAPPPGAGLAQAAAAYCWRPAAPARRPPPRAA